MFFQSALIIALATSSSQAFTASPLASAPPRQQQNGYQSTSQLFDTEQTTLWSKEQWSAEMATRAPDSNTFGSAKTDLQAQSAVDLLQLPKFAPSKGGIEQEFPAKKKKGRVSVKETGYDSMKNYIKTMCNHELLNKNEEIILAREIQVLLKWEEQREELEQQLLR
jgi:hypothetical protein